MTRKYKITGCDGTSIVLVLTASEVDELLKWLHPSVKVTLVR